MRGISKVLAALVMTLWAGFVFAQLPGRLAPGTGIITGVIQIDGGGTSAGVRVAVISVDDAFGANLISLSETDSSGRFRLTDIPQGHYYVVAGRVSSFTFFPGGTDRTAAKEVVVEPARTVTNINFRVPADSRRPPSDTSTSAKSAVELTTYQRASKERNSDTRIKLLLSFEKNFPKSLLLPKVYGDLIDLYIANGDPGTAMRYGDRLLESEPNDVWALLKVSQAYGMAQTNLRAAREYAEKAVAAVAKLKAIPYAARPSEFRDVAPIEWPKMIQSLDANSKSNLEWVNQVIVWHQKALNAALRPRR